MVEKSKLLSVILEGEWFHVAATYDGTTAKFYKDGNLAANGPLTFGPTTDTTFVFGCC